MWSAGPLSFSLFIFSFDSSFTHRDSTLVTLAHSTRRSLTRTSSNSLHFMLLVSQRIADSQLIRLLSPDSLSSRQSCHAQQIRVTFLQRLMWGRFWIDEFSHDFHVKADCGSHRESTVMWTVREICERTLHVLLAHLLYAWWDWQLSPVFSNAASGPKGSVQLSGGRKHCHELFPYTFVYMPIVDLTAKVP